MSGEPTIRGAARASARLACVLTLSTLLLATLLAGPASAATTHDPILGFSLASNNPPSGILQTTTQDNSDVAVDAFGRIHVVWQDVREGNLTIMYARSDDRGHSFGPSIYVDMPETAPGALNPSIAVDANGNPHVAWEDQRNSLSRGSDIYYARSYDGGDTFGPNVRVNSDTDPVAQSTPSIAVGPSGDVFVVYVSGSANAADVYLSASIDGGRTFQAMTRVNDDAAGNRQSAPAVTGDRFGTAHIAWTDFRASTSDPDVLYAFRPTTGTVSSNVRVNSDGPNNENMNPSIALDDITPVISWTDNRNGNRDIYLARRTSPTAFGTNVRVNSDASATTQFASCVATSGEGRVHVVWTALQSSQYDIYLANSTDGGATFGAEGRVSRDAAPGLRQDAASLAASPFGWLAVSWDDYDDGAPADIDVALTVVDGDGSQHPVEVSDVRPDAFEHSVVTAIGPDGRLHAVWGDNRRNEYALRYVASSDGGLTWGSRATVTGPPGLGRRVQLTPDVAVGPDGTVHVVWTEISPAKVRVMYANNRGRPTGFNAPSPVDDSPDGGFAVNPSIAAAPNGSLVVAWLDGRAGHVRVRAALSRDTGVTWQSSVPVPSTVADSHLGPPSLAIRDGLVAIAFTDDKDGGPAPWMSTGSFLGSLGTPVSPFTTTALPPEAWRGIELSLAVDSDPAGPVMLAFTTHTRTSSDVAVALYRDDEGTFTALRWPAEGAGAGPRFRPSIAVGDGGTMFLAFGDLTGATSSIVLMVEVPDLAPGAPKRLPSSSPGPTPAPCTSVDLAFSQHHLAAMYIDDAAAAPRAGCARYENSPPTPPEVNSPANGGWVTTTSFNLSIAAPTDEDGDTVLVRFHLEGPEGLVLDRPYAESTRMLITDAPSGQYVWWATVTDGFGAFTSEMWTFQVDLNPPLAPELVPEPEYTASTFNTIYWNATTDPEGNEVSYKVEASQSPEFRPPLLADSGWTVELNHTFEGLPSAKIYYRLYARDAAGNTVEAASTTHSTQDTSEPRLILFIRPPLTANQSEPVTFDASGSTDDHGIASYEWDYDDDGTIDDEGAIVTHAFEDAGSYNVSVTLTDVAGNRKRFSGYEMTIKDISAPSIVLNVDPGTSFPEDTTATFDSEGTWDYSGIKFLKWFLDGAATPFAVGATATHLFSEPGNYTLRLEAIDVHGNSANETVALTVADVTPPVVSFNPYGPFDNTKIEFFTLYVNVTDNDRVVSVTLSYKTQEESLFRDVPMSRAPGSLTEWYKDEVGVGGKGNATYYIRAVDAAGNEEKTDYQKIVVTGTATPQKPGQDGEGFDIMDWWWLILIVVLVVVVAGVGYAVSSRRRQRTAEGAVAPTTGALAPAAAAARRDMAAATSPATAATAEALAVPMGKDAVLCAIEDVYFIHADGRLVHSASAGGRADATDRDIFAGMFTAIRDFIQDSMARDGELGSFEYGSNRIVIERGNHITLAVTLFGAEPPHLRDDLRDVLRQVEGSYAGVIERWDGDKGKLKGISEWGNKVLGLTGGIDRETVLKAREKKGVKLVSEVEFFQGFVRLKVAVKNDTETVITDSAIDIVYDDTVLRLDHIQPVYEFKRGKVHLGNVLAGEKKTVAFNFDPIICMESMIDGTLTYRDLHGKLQVVSMKSRRADIVCPIFFTRENANTAMLKRLVREELSAQDSKVYRYPDGLAPLQAFELCKGVVHLHDVKFVREFIEPKPSWLGEAWFYGETKVKGFKIVIRVTVREASHSAEFFVASQQMEVITGLLAELGHSLNRMLKEKYMGRLKAQPIVDSKLKKDITEQPLLLERAEE